MPTDVPELYCIGRKVNSQRSVDFIVLNVAISDKGGKIQSCMDVLTYRFSEILPYLMCFPRNSNR